MEDKNIFSKFMLQTQTKYKNTKIQTCLQGFYHEVCWKIYLTEVSYSQNSDIREVIIALYDKITPNILSKADPGFLQHLIMEISTKLVNGFKWLPIAINGFHLRCCRGLRPTS